MTLISKISRQTSFAMRATAFALLASGVFLTPSSKALAAPEIGTSAAVRGSVFVTTSGASRKARVRDAIKLQDKVLTKDDSALQILLLDRSTFTVGQNCSMTIDRFVYDPDTTAGQISANVVKGAFRFMSGNIGKNNPTDASVSTPAATIGIRGTFFEGIVGEDAVALAQLAGLDTGSADRSAATLTILRGPGAARNTLDSRGIITIGNTAGSKTIIRPNFAVFTPGPGQAPVGPFRVTSDMQSYLDFFLRSEPNGPPSNPGGLSETGEQASGQDLFETPSGTTEGSIDDDLFDGITDPNVEIDDDFDEYDEFPTTTPIP
ncbi:MAG: FecR family protein [Pseudomonadota bacterium]